VVVEKGGGGRGLLVARRRRLWRGGVAGKEVSSRLMLICGEAAAVSATFVNMPSVSHSTFIPTTPS